MTDPNKEHDQKGAELVPFNSPENTEAVMPDEILQPRQQLNERYGEVIYDATGENTGQYQALDEALSQFDKNSGNVIESISSKDPGKIRSAIESAKASREAMQIAHDRLIQKREAQELQFENATGENRVQVDRFNQRRAAIQAEAAAHKSEKWSNYVSAPIQGILGGALGGVLGGLGKGIAKFWYGMRGVKDSYMQKKTERGVKGKN